MGILKSICAALQSALKAIAGVALAPFRMLGNLVGGGGGGWTPQLPEMPEDKGPDPEVERQRRVAEGVVLANAMIGYASDSIIDQCPAPLPPQLTPPLREWARGLSEAECSLIMSASENDVNAHIAGLIDIEGVRSVQPLPTATWGRKPSADDADDFDLNAADGPRLSYA